MPNMADITVKKADNTTDVIYVAKTPAAGDKTQALWRSDTQGTSAATKPSLAISSQNNGPKTARRVETHFVFCQTATDSTTGLVEIVNRIPFHVTATLPAEVPDTVIAEASAQWANLHDSTLVQSVFQSGFAPT